MFNYEINALMIILTVMTASTFTKQSSSVFKVKLNCTFLTALSKENSNITLLGLVSAVFRDYLRKFGRQT